MYNKINKEILLPILEELIRNNGQFHSEKNHKSQNLTYSKTQNFAYKSIIYHPKIGQKMGAPTSRLYAKIYVNFYMNIKKQRLINEGIHTIHKYIDDIL